MNPSRLWPLLAIACAHAEFSIPGFELVHTAPVETTLATPDLRDPATVWSELFDAAQKEIVIEQFYVSGGEPLDGVIRHLEAAGQRGVQIRFLMEDKGQAASNPETIARLKRIPNLEFRLLNFGQLTGCIIHAKFLVTDRKQAFVGSQNFDWRSLQHIHETGLRISDAGIAGQLQDIFEQDWQAQALQSQGSNAAPRSLPPMAAATQASAVLVASPNAYNPPGVGDSESTLPKLLAEAREEVRIQLLDYEPLSHGPQRQRPFYPVIDNAIRAALARGVKVKLMVSNWNTEKPGIGHLKSLARLPGMQIRIVTLPQAASGFIPYARVLHSKAMTIDGQIAWVGTSNWSGGYLDKSRNVELVLRNASMAGRLAALHEQTWVRRTRSRSTSAKTTPSRARAKSLFTIFLRLRPAIPGPEGLARQKDREQALSALALIAWVC